MGYDTQEPLENTINTHGYTVRGTPNGLLKNYFFSILSPCRQETILQTFSSLLPHSGPSDLSRKIWENKRIVLSKPSEVEDYIYLDGHSTWQAINRTSHMLEPSSTRENLVRDVLDKGGQAKDSKAGKKKKQ